MRRDDLDEKFAADAQRGLLQLQQRRILLGAQVGRIIRVIEAKALGDVIERPFDELTAKVGTALEAQRDRTRLLDGTSDPETPLARPKQGIAAEVAIAQHTNAVGAARRAGRGFYSEFLEWAEACGVRTEFGTKVDQLLAMVDCQCQQPGPLP